MFNYIKVIKRLNSLCEDNHLLCNTDPIQIHSNMNISIKFSEKDVKKIQLVISIIRNNKDYFNNDFKKKEIEKKIIKILQNTMKKPIQERKEIIKSSIMQMKLDLEEQIIERTYYIPIINLQIERPLKIGNVTFISNNKSFQKRLKKQNQMIFGPNPHYSQIKKKEMIRSELEFLNKTNCNRILCYAQISQIGFEEICRKNALIEVRYAINAMRLYWEKVDENTSCYFGIFGESNNIEMRCIISIHNENSRIKYEHEHTGILGIYTVTPEIRKLYSKKEFKKINEILKKRSNLTELEQSLVSAIYWYGESINIRVFGKRRSPEDTHNEPIENYSENDKFLKLFISIESILSTDERGGITNNLSERAAFLLGNSRSQRHHIKKN